MNIIQNIQTSMPRPHQRADPNPPQPAIGLGQYSANRAAPPQLRAAKQWSSAWLPCSCMRMLSLSWSWSSIIYPNSRWPPGRANVPLPVDPLRFPSTTQFGCASLVTKTPTPMPGLFTRGWLGAAILILVDLSWRYNFTSMELYLCTVSMANFR